MTITAIPLSWVVCQCAGAVAGGLSLDRLFENALIRREYGDDRDCISPSQLGLLYTSIVYNTRDEAHALSTRPIDLGLGSLAYRVLFGSSTLQSGIDAIIKLYQLSNKTMALKLFVKRDVAFLALKCVDDTPGAMLLEDCHLGHIFIGISHFLGRPLPALYVTTRDPEHVNLGTMHWSIRAPVEFGSNSGIAFPRAVLGASRQTSLEDDPRWGAIQRWLDFAEPDPALEISPLANIKLLKASGSGETTPSGARAQAAGFRRARQNILVDAAIRLLTNTRDSVESIAAQLGYSEARSFRRFMKGATGRTPDQIRCGFGIPVRNLLVHERYRQLLARIPG